MKIGRHTRGPAKTALSPPCGRHFQVTLREEETMPDITWTLSRDRKTVATPGNAQVGGSVTARSATIAGDLRVGGTLAADQIRGPIHYSQITGLLGDGFTLRIPDIANNLAEVEISGMASGEMVIVTGPGYDIERIPGFQANGVPDDQPGFSQAHPFVFEVGGAEAAALQAGFDQHATNPGLFPPRDMSLLVKDRSGAEAFRWNFYAFEAVNYEPAADGRTRFRWAPTSPVPYCIEARDKDDPFVDGVSYDPATDTRVDIEGVAEFAPTLEVDEADRTLTMTFGLTEGGGILIWVKNTINGITDKRSASTWTPLNGAKQSGRAYFGCFPVKYEQHSGFALSSKIRARVTVSYDRFEDF